MNLDLSWSSKNQISIHSAQDDVTRKLIYKLRYKVMIEEMNKPHPFADHKNRMLYDNLDYGPSTLLYAIAEDEIIASLRISWGSGLIPDEYKNYFLLALFSDYPPDAFSFSSRFVIDLKWRKTNVFKLLAIEAYKHIRENKSHFNFCHSRKELVPMYEKLGYRCYGEPFMHEYLGFQQRLVLLTEDVNHLKQKESIFFQVAQQHENNGQHVTNWFNQKFVYNENENNSLH